MECKGANPAEKFLPADGFNRYIVECKVEHLSVELSEIYRFNRYIVECKEMFKAAFHDYEWEI